MALTRFSLGLQHHVDKGRGRQEEPSMDSWRLQQLEPQPGAVWAVAVRTEIVW